MHVSELYSGKLGPSNIEWVAEYGNHLKSTGARALSGVLSQAAHL
jgi:hypothetical protein